MWAVRMGLRCLGTGRQRERGQRGADEDKFHVGFLCFAVALRSRLDRQDYPAQQY